MVYDKASGTWKSLAAVAPDNTTDDSHMVYDKAAGAGKKVLASKPSFDETNSLSHDFAVNDVNDIMKTSVAFVGESLNGRNVPSSLRVDTNTHEFAVNGVSDIMKTSLAFVGETLNNQNGPSTLSIGAVANTVNTLNKRRQKQNKISSSPSPTNNIASRKLFVSTPDAFDEKQITPLRPQQIFTPLPPITSPVHAVTPVLEPIGNSSGIVPQSGGSQSSSKWINLKNTIHAKMALTKRVATIEDSSEVVYSSRVNPEDALVSNDTGESELSAPYFTFASHNTIRDSELYSCLQQSDLINFFKVPYTNSIFPRYFINHMSDMSESFVVYFGTYFTHSMQICVILIFVPIFAATAPMVVTYYVDNSDTYCIIAATLALVLQLFVVVLVALFGDVKSHFTCVVPPEESDEHAIDIAQEVDQNRARASWNKLKAITKVTFSKHNKRKVVSKWAVGKAGAKLIVQNHRIERNLAQKKLRSIELQSQAYNLTAEEELNTSKSEAQLRLHDRLSKIHNAKGKVRDAMIKANIADHVEEEKHDHLHHNVLDRLNARKEKRIIRAHKYLGVAAAASKFTNLLRKSATETKIYVQHRDEEAQSPKERHVLKRKNKQELDAETQQEALEASKRAFEEEEMRLAILKGEAEARAREEAEMKINLANAKLKEEAVRRAKIEEEIRIANELAEKNALLEKEALLKADLDRKAKLEYQKKQKIVAEKKAEIAKKEKAEKARLEMVQKEKAETARLEMVQKERAEKARLEMVQKEKAEKARLEMVQKEKARLEMVQKEKDEQAKRDQEINNGISNAVASVPQAAKEVTAKPNNVAAAVKVEATNKVSSIVQHSKITSLDRLANIDDDDISQESEESEDSDITL
jgi:hypothetical protein